MSSDKDITVNLGINWVNFPQGSERRHLQKIAAESWRLAQEQNSKINFFTIGEQKDLESAPNFMKRTPPLIRGAWSIFRYEKNVPFLRDILTCLLRSSENQPMSIWFGYLNSDIILKQDFYDRLLGLQRLKYTSIICRADEIPVVNNLEEAYRATPFRLDNSGRDLYLFQLAGGRKLLEQLPDYLIGEPAWDIDAYRILMQETRMHDDVDTSALTIHMNHERDWISQPTIGRQYNEILYCCKYRLAAVDQDGFYSRHLNR